MIGPNDTVVNQNDIQNYRGVFTHNTRRAAKMLVVDVDHPDILEYIMWKSHEEEKAKALIASGYEADFNGEAYKTVSGQNGNNSISVSHEFMRAFEQDEEWEMWKRADKKKYQDAIGNVNLEDLRKTSKPAKTCKASKIWDAMIDSSWKCADPAVHFNGTMNDWNTLATDGRIWSTNPCLSGDTYVYIVEKDDSIKKVKIKDVVEKDIRVITYDFNKQEIALVKAKNLGITRSNSKVIKVKTSKGSVSLTPDHEIMTNRGWIQAKDLQKGDKVYKLKSEEMN